MTKRIKLTEIDFEILPANLAECNDFGDVYCLVIDTKSPSREFLPRGKTEWLPKDKAEQLKQQILENQEIVERLKKEFIDCDEYPPLTKWYKSILGEQK